MTNKPANARKEKAAFGALPQQPQTSPAEARQRRRNRKIPDDVVIIAPTGSADTAIKSLSGGNPIVMSSISELARALRNDVDLIYQYVHDNITFIPTYGLHKGGLGALVDGSGNQFDQCDLMVKLLTAAGHTAKYVVGDVRLTSAQWSTMLGVNSSDLTLAIQLLNNGGIGVSGVIGTDLVFEHCWVKVNIGGTDFCFDPSLKSHTTISPVSALGTKLGYDRTTFLAAAKATATSVPGLSVRNISASSINTNLSTYTDNLINWIKTSASPDPGPGATLAQIIGGRLIVPTSGTIRNTTLPYQNGTPVESLTVSDADKCWFQFAYDKDPSTGLYNIKVGGYTDVLYGFNLTLWWNGGRAAVYFNGVQQGPLSAIKAAGSVEDAIFTIDHPYATGFADVSLPQPVHARAPALIGNCFGVSSKQLAAIHQQNQNQLIANGATASSEPLLGTSLSLIWDNFIGQSSNAVDMLKRLGNTEVVLHHCIGLIAQTSKPTAPTTAKIKSISSFILQWSTAKRASSVSNDSLSATNFCISTVVQSLEGTASEQVTGLESGDAIKVISICNQAGVDIYDAKITNWNTGANIRNILYNGGLGYTNAVLDEIEDWVNLGTPWRVAVPNDPTVQIGSFTDFYGYIALNGASTYSTTWFGAKGAASAGDQDDAGTNSAASDNARQVNGFGMPAVTASESTRVNMLNGRFEYSSTDLTVGNQGFPYSLAFTRSYNSDLRLSLMRVSSGDNGLGFGWSHNWLLKAYVNSDGFIPLGDQQVSAAVPAIAAFFVMHDIAANDSSLPVDNFVIECEVARFLVRQFWNNVVRLQTSSGTQVFTKLPNGTYLPGLGMHGASVLSMVGSQFVLSTPEKVVYTYKTTGEIETIEFPYGITITFTYASGRLQKVSNSFREINFAYDTFGQLASVNDGNGRTVDFTVPTSGTQAGNLTAVKDPLNQITTYNYDQRGRLTQVFKPANPLAPIFTNTYDSSNRIKEQRDAYENLWQFFIAGTRSEEVAPNNTSRVNYFNSNGSVVRTINALGQALQYEFDGNERELVATLPEGNKVIKTYDANGNLLTVTARAKPALPMPADRTTTRTYENVWNKIATETGPGGGVTSYEYFGVGIDGASLTKKVTGPIVAAGAAISQYTYNSKGQLLTSTDPTLIQTLNVYDAVSNNLLSTVVDPGSAPHLNITTSFTYDAIGNVLSTVDPRGNTTVSTYDANRQVTVITGPAPQSQVSTATYDGNGNVIERRSLVATDPNTQVSRFAFAIDGRLIQAMGPENFGDGVQSVPAKFEYDSLRRRVRSIDGEGNEGSVVYDELSRVSSVRVNGEIQQQRSYTVNGKLATVSDARGKITSYQHDEFDRMNKVTYPDGKFEALEYDVRDNVLKVTNRDGSEIAQTYDAVGQVLTKSVTGKPTVSLTFDKAGRPLTHSTPYVPGDPSTGTFSMFYDSAGRMYKEQYPDGKTVLAVLNKNANVESLQYPDGSSVNYVFDNLDCITSVSGFGASTSFTNDSATRRLAQINGNGTGQGYTYDKIDQPMSFSIGGLKNSLALPTKERVDVTHGWNALAQKNSEIVSDESFLWSPQTARTQTYGTANDVNQYPTVNGVLFTYNDNGCLVNDGVNTYGYDSENNLVSVTRPGLSVFYKYDPMGRLCEKATGSTKVRYLYSGIRRIEEYDASNNLLRRYVYGPGLDECLFTVNSSGLVTYVHADALGSTILTTDGTGTPTAKNIYSPTGELVSGSLASVPIGFASQFYDTDTGLYYLKSRHYSPWLGRFMQPDPDGYQGGLNLYEYCYGDPVNGSDPLGWGPLQGNVTVNEPSFETRLSALMTQLAASARVNGILGNNYSNVSALNSGGYLYASGANPAQLQQVLLVLAVQRMIAEQQAAALQAALAAQRALITAVKIPPVFLGRAIPIAAAAAAGGALVWKGVGIAQDYSVQMNAGKRMANTNVHRNSLWYEGPSYVYVIRDKQANDWRFRIYKFGMASPYDFDESRMDRQVMRLNGGNPSGRFEGEILEWHPVRRTARESERFKIILYRYAWGHALLGNRTLW